MSRRSDAFACELIGLDLAWRPCRARAGVARASARSQAQAGAGPLRRREPRPRGGADTEGAGAGDCGGGRLGPGPACPTLPRHLGLCCAAGGNGRAVAGHCPLDLRPKARQWPSWCRIGRGRRGSITATSSLRGRPLNDWFTEAQSDPMPLVDCAREKPADPARRARTQHADQRPYPRGRGDVPDFLASRCRHHPPLDRVAGEGECCVGGGAGPGSAPKRCGSVRAIRPFPAGISISGSGPGDIRAAYFLLQGRALAPAHPCVRARLLRLLARSRPQVRRPQRPVAAARVAAGRVARMAACLPRCPRPRLPGGAGPGSSEPRGGDRTDGATGAADAHRRGMAAGLHRGLAGVEPGSARRCSRPIGTNSAMRTGRSTTPRSTATCWPRWGLRCRRRARRAFAQDQRIDEASFRLPVYWLAIGKLPVTYRPEILGLNLAMELSGVGGSYRSAREFLKHYGFPTIFVDLHNTIDNVSTGHSAWAADAIDAYVQATRDVVPVAESWARIPHRVRVAHATRRRSFRTRFLWRGNPPAKTGEGGCCALRDQPLPPSTATRDGDCPHDEVSPWHFGLLSRQRGRARRGRQDHRRGPAGAVQPHPARQRLSRGCDPLLPGDGRRPARRSRHDQLLRGSDAEARPHAVVVCRARVPAGSGPSGTSCRNGSAGRDAPRTWSPRASRR